MLIFLKFHSLSTATAEREVLDSDWSAGRPRRSARAWRGIALLALGQRPQPPGGPASGPARHATGMLGRREDSLPHPLGRGCRGLPRVAVASSAFSAG